MKLKNPDFKHIKNIIFDFGNVIIDIDVNLTVRAFEQLGLYKLNEQDIHPLNTGIFLDLELGHITNEKFIEELKGFAVNSNLSDMALYYAWNMLLLPYDFKRFELIDKLRDKYNVYLLSNTNLPHREYFIQKFNAENPANRTFESYFDKCFYSDAMHLRKPDTAIYAQVLSEAGIEAHTTLFVDDNAPNILGARQAGLEAYHLVKPETIFDLFIK